jgi:hypothetical protein
MATTNQAIVFTRAVSAADSSLAAVPLWATNATGTLIVGATCDTPNATLTARIFGFSAPGILAAISALITFTAVNGDDYGSLCSASPDNNPWQSLEGVPYTAIKVDSVSAGNWTLTASASYPTATTSL